ncbi:hypothetical protein HispidOSU_022123 [Sigmodon hispidus]
MDQHQLIMDQHQLIMDQHQLIMDQHQLIMDQHQLIMDEASGCHPLACLSLPPLSDQGEEGKRDREGAPSTAASFPLLLQLGILPSPGESWNSDFPFTWPAFLLKT